MAGNLRDLDITKDELDRIGQALKHEEFRNLLVEYCQELNDPATKKRYEEEIVQLERERGIEVTFVNPTPGHVIKTSADGANLVFINVCSNANVQVCTSECASQEGSRGHQWSIPHLLSPPRDDVNKSGAKCKVYDVIFHPDTLALAAKHKQFREMVHNVSCEAVESHFSVTLDKANLKFPKLKYKGVSRPVVIRRNRREKAAEVDGLYADIYRQIDEHYETSKHKAPAVVLATQEKPGYATPKYCIKHRSDVDVQDFTYDPAAKRNAALPKELVVEILLPLLKSSGDVILDVTERSLHLVSEKPAKYKLELALPYAVHEDQGCAKFDVDTRTLLLVLPVTRTCHLLSDIGRYDSGVDSDSTPPTGSPSARPRAGDSAGESQCSSVQSDSEVFRTSGERDFLAGDRHYALPEYSCHLFGDVLSFTVHVKNVTAGSIETRFSANGAGVHVRFSSISSGYFPVNYAFYASLPSHRIRVDEVLVEPWDNNVIVQVPFEPSDEPVGLYNVGTCPETCAAKYLEEPSIISGKQVESLREEESAQPTIQVQLHSDDEIAIVVQSEKGDASGCTLRTDHKATSNAKNIVKARSLSESSGDELSTSHSPSKSKSILKSNRPRFGISRSVSESSVDDYTWSSFETCGATSESLIPEEGEISSSMKKTVRFNDVVSKQLFRSNSSILGQRKKNQRKSRNKKKAYERRLSESENSEAEDRKEKCLQRNKNGKEKGSSGEDDATAKDSAQIDFKSDLIFDLDM